MHKKRFSTTALFFSAAFVAAALLAAGCGKGGKVIAKIGGTRITVKDFENRMKEMPEGSQKYLQTGPGKRQFLDLLVREHLIYEEAKRQKVDRRKEITGAVKEFRSSYRKKMKDYERELVTTTLLGELQEKEFVPGRDELAGYYKEHKTLFTNPVEYTVSHILLNSEAEAKDAVKRLKAGEKFADLAREISIDPQSSTYGGELGTFKRGELFPEFEAVLEKLPEGRVSDVVRTSYGYHVIRKTGEKKLQPMDFEKAKNTITKLLLKDKFDAWVEKKKSELGVKINEQF